MTSISQLVFEAPLIWAQLRDCQVFLRIVTVGPPVRGLLVGCLPDHKDRNMAYEAPRVRTVGLVADVTLAQGQFGHDDQWVSIDTTTGQITQYGPTYGTHVS